jgi:hypothetical protein
MGEATRTTVSLEQVEQQEVVQQPAEGVEQPVPEVQPAEETQAPIEEDVQIPIIDTENEPVEEAKVEEEQPKPKPKIEDILPELAKLTTTKKELTEEDLKPFLEQGFDATEVTLAFKGLKAEIAEKVNELYSLVGGKEQYNEMVQWANQNLPVEERKELADIIASGDTKLMKWAILGLNARYTQMNQQAYVSGTAAPSNANVIKPFASKEEMYQALTDPRIDKDPAYREMVYQRAALTQL